MRRRQPDPPPAEVVEQSAPTIDGVPVEPQRRTAAERLNDEIEAQQLALQNREKELEQVRRRLAAEWEAAGRPRERWAMDLHRRRIRISIEGGLRPWSDGIEP